ncbi:MFS domain-containing protein [Fusarium keratoplasticum]|uniref:MFS domain-containing protein n=1 Tax=Fusarium keratoplasticum TaxID=1328300 RepID=A0ACC0RCQ4_9HYPO|nr:MFS domain-containing protein [Fusarium keratoplasticum]KAI8683886.1 MFS domain-containing protein [Fusarium keratoplasticum]KAI8687999.1 MFS domain-containing protein [Fusarium keratoplasticum]
MHSLGQALSALTLKPDIGNQKHESPYVNERGYVDFNSGDAENPRNWSRTRRWIITSIAVILALNGNFSSSIFAASLDSVVDEFNVSEVAAALTTALFLLGFCAGPFIFAPLSEFYGRRWIFYITFAAYMAFTFLCAFPPGFGGLLVGRFLAGTFISAPLSTTPGVLVDLWDPIERGNATAIFSLASWVGPSLGSVISGFVQLERDWRWGVYSALWLGAPTMALMFLIPETHSPTILAQKSKRARHSGITGAQTEGEENKPKLHQLYKMALTRPWILMFDLISLLCSVYACIVFTLQFMLFSIYPIVFREMRGWNAGVSQLPLIGQVVGAVLGAIVIFVDSERRRSSDASGKKLLPEDRLLMAMFGGVGFPITMFWLAWSAQYNQVPWIVPTLAGTFLSTSLMLIYVAIINYLTDTYTDYTASVIAANTVTRSAGSAAAPLFTNQMFSALGVGGGGSLIGGVATLLALIPFVFYKYGSRIRRKSKYALVDGGQLEKVDEEADPTDYGVQPDETQHAGELSKAAAGNRPEE